MVKKFVITFFSFILFSGISLFSQNGLLPNSEIDISAFEKRFKAVDESMNYLKNKNIDYNDIITIYTESESLLREVKYTSELKDYDMAIRFLSHKLVMLEDKTSERVSLAKRMDLMYFLMVGMGLAMIIITAIYSIYMYSRRK